MAKSGVAEFIEVVRGVGEVGKFVFGIAGYDFLLVAAARSLNKGLDSYSDPIAGEAFIPNRILLTLHSHTVARYNQPLVESQELNTTTGTLRE